MSDSSAQSSQRMVSSFVGNPNSAVGSLLKRSLNGVSSNQPSKQPVNLKNDDSLGDTPAVNSTKPVITPASPNPVSIDPINDSPDTDSALNDLELLEKAIADAEASDVKSKVAAQAAQSVEKTLPEDKVAETQSVLTQQNEFVDESNNQQLENTADQTGLISQVIPQVVQESTDTLNPQNPVGSAGSKESADSAVLDQIAVDAARGVQQVEVEPTPEISPEVESYLQKVEQHADTAPQEIVIADGSMTQPNNHPYPSQPVVVLPITPELEKKGAHKSPKLSVRWLVEWSKKIMKVFSGKVIYRLPEEDKL